MSHFPSRVLFGPIRGVLGDRRFNHVWGGSVVDSVIGTYLTQNVSDTLSSTAYMNLAAKFKFRDRCIGSLPKWRDTANWLELLKEENAGKVQDAIRCRGMHMKLAKNIQSFIGGIHILQLRTEVTECLSRLSILGEDECASKTVPGLEKAECNQDGVASTAAGKGGARVSCRCGHPHCSGELCLEWLRALPANEASDFLASLGGLGRKSCACISLLSLGHKVRGTRRPLMLPAGGNAAIHRQLDDRRTSPLMSTWAGYVLAWGGSPSRATRPSRSLTITPLSQWSMPSFARGSWAC